MTPELSLPGLSKGRHNDALYPVSGDTGGLADASGGALRAIGAGARSRPGVEPRTIDGDLKCAGWMKKWSMVVAERADRGWCGRWIGRSRPAVL